MANGKQAKLILFDSDGVVIDSFALLHRNIAELFQLRAGKELTESQYRDLFDGNAF